MQPTLNEILNGGNIRWRFEKNGIPYIVSFHGYSDDPKFPHPGIWCYYILIDEAMFEPEDFNKMIMDVKVYDWGLSYDYYSFPDLDFHGGITSYEINDSWDKRLKKPIRCIKVGCDYNHLWDSERGYSYDLEYVKFEAEHSIDILLRLFPNHKIRCAYSGWYDKKENFYLAKMGKMVHNEFIDKIKEIGWDNWLPKEK